MYSNCLEYIFLSYILDFIPQTQKYLIAVFYPAFKRVMV